MPGEPYDGLLTPQAFLDARERMDGDAGKCPTCGSDRCVGRLQYENCDLAAALPPVAPDRTCARYWGSDGTLCSTHNGRFASGTDMRCDRRDAPPVAPDGADGSIECPVCGGTGYLVDVTAAIEEATAHGHTLMAVEDVETRAYLAVERSAVIAAARLFLEAHDRVIANTPVTRDDTFAMKNAADNLRNVLGLHGSTDVVPSA